jgi:hypothetical protein
VVLAVLAVPVADKKLGKSIYIHVIRERLGAIFLEVKGFRKKYVAWP